MVRTDRDYMSWEVCGHRAVRQGDWKLRWQIDPYGKSDWELFNLGDDLAERNDLASKKPEKVTAMLKLWNEYVATNNVIIPSRTSFEGLKKVLPQRSPISAH